MLNIGNKTFMNLQEAVGWLLENNALPFQSTANYVGNTEIAMSTLINPSPAKVRVGSIIFFADSKVSTVVGVTSNSFIVSDQYNDLVDDVVYVSNVAINGSGHLIVTLSNGDTIDAGLIKQVSNFSIDASQHLIVTYNDASTTDLGAIFNGNVNIAGNLTADSIIENMTGYYADTGAAMNNDFTILYQGVVKNGNKLTLVWFVQIDATQSSYSGDIVRGTKMPLALSSKLVTYDLSGIDNLLDCKVIPFYYGYNQKIDVPTILQKYTASLTVTIQPRFYATGLTPGTTYLARIEATFLLSDNLAS